MSPERECVGVVHADEYGAGPLEYMEEEGLTTAVAIVGREVYGRSVVIRSIFSRLMRDNIPLGSNVR